MKLQFNFPFFFITAATIGSYMQILRIMRMIQQLNNNSSIPDSAAFSLSAQLVSWMFVYLTLSVLCWIHLRRLLSMWEVWFAIVAYLLPVPLMNATGTLAYVISLPYVYAVCCAVYTRRLKRRRVDEAERKGAMIVGFFHPYCNSGGGGERVLWQYVRTLQESNKLIDIVIYTGDKEEAQSILQKAASRFNLPLLSTVNEGNARNSGVTLSFQRLRLRPLVEAKTWPRFTMFGQSFGSALLALEALCRFPCDVFIDTTGWSFTYPIAKFIFGCSVHAYIHYPTISTDMLQVVSERRATYNNAESVSRNRVFAMIKLLYYRLFSLLYTLTGKCCDLAFVNSSWTRAHIEQLWRLPKDRIVTVYPPCDTSTLQQLPLGKIPTFGAAASAASPVSAPSSSSSKTIEREPLIISIAQFRPEKDHALQLRAFARFLELLRERERKQPAVVRGSNAPPPMCPLSVRVQLVMIGGVRDEGDAARVAALRELAASLRVSDQVEFLINADFSVLKDYLGASTAALHTMWNEHFGIGVVEFMAAGVVTIAHNSGGPKADIVVSVDGERTGYLAATVDEYAAALLEVFASPFTGSAAMQRMRESARRHAASFSDEVFVAQLQQHLLPFLQVAVDQWPQVTLSLPITANQARSRQSHSDAHVSDVPSELQREDSNATTRTGSSSTSSTSQKKKRGGSGGSSKKKKH